MRDVDIPFPAVMVCALLDLAVKPGAVLECFKSSKSNS
jgi:hypothetical protein